MKTRLRQIALQARLPGRPTVIAELQLTAADLTERYRIQFDEAMENDGLGPYQVALTEAPSGTRFALVWYQQAPSRHTLLYTAHQADPERALTEFLEITGLPPEAVAWRLGDTVAWPADRATTDTIPHDPEQWVGPGGHRDASKESPKSLAISVLTAEDRATSRGPRDPLALWQRFSRRAIERFSGWRLPW